MKWREDFFAFDSKNDSYAIYKKYWIIRFKSGNVFRYKVESGVLIIAEFSTHSEAKRFIDKKGKKK